MHLIRRVVVVLVLAACLYAWGIRYARGRVLDVRVEAETYPITGAGLQADFARNDQVPFVDLVATHDAPNREASVLMLNRDLEGERELVLDWGEMTPTRVLTCETLTGSDLKAFNTFEQPRLVAPQRFDVGDGRVRACPSSRGSSGS